METSHYGIHTVTGVKMSSPAQQSGHIEKGDEILQVNFCTVVSSFISQRQRAGPSVRK
jgi:C-terminal processing protease CtpA/Prc